MKVSHADEAADNGYDAPKLDFVITRYAIGEVVCDLAMKSDHQQAGNRDCDAAEEPAPAE